MLREVHIVGITIQNRGLAWKIMHQPQMTSSVDFWKWKKYWVKWHKLQGNFCNTRKHILNIWTLPSIPVDNTMIETNTTHAGLLMLCNCTEILVLDFTSDMIGETRHPCQNILGFPVTPHYHWYVGMSTSVGKVISSPGSSKVTAKSRESKSQHQ